MAKDRTRHARRMESDSRYEPLFETFGQEIGQAIIDFAEEQWQMAVSLANDTIDVLLARNIDIRKWGRMESEHDTD